jgi:ABC-type nitrate/sulfonate/bicarbonate transport system permease component
LMLEMVSHMLYLYMKVIKHTPHISISEILLFELGIVRVFFVFIFWLFLFIILFLNVMDYNKNSYLDISSWEIADKV